VAARRLIVGLMLSRHELTAFCVAPATAPVVAALLRGGSSRWEIVTVAAYFAAFTIGMPLFCLLRKRGRSLLVCSLVAAAVAGLLAGSLLVALLLLAISVPKFVANLGSVAMLAAVGSAWGLGLGVIAGLALLALLRVRTPPMLGA
jgi:hypothetical protein